MSWIVKLGKKGKKIVKKIITPAEKHYVGYTRRIERVKTGERICAMTFDDGPMGLPASPDRFEGKTLTDVLLDTLAHEADRKSVYILQLPAVTYEGGLTMKNFCCDLIGSESGTTFTGTVTITTRGIHPSNITNVRFVGDGTGIGLSASEGAFLHRCTFENWEIGAYGGLGSWVNATGCTFRGNDVGL